MPTAAAALPMVLTEPKVEVCDPASTFVAAKRLRAKLEPYDKSFGMVDTPTWLDEVLAHVKIGGRLLVGIEGVIGTGKSTQADLLGQELSRRGISSRKVAVLLEPVKIWQKHGLLDGIYNQKLSPTNFQQTALTTRLVAVLKALQEGVQVIFMERSPWTDQSVFADINLDNASMDRVAYDVTWASQMSLLEGYGIKTALLYLRTCQETAAERMRARGRSAEASIPTAYLKKLFDAHEDLFNSFESYRANRPAWETHELYAYTIDATASEGEVFRRLMNIVDPIAQTLVDAMDKP